jgi:predicted TIM-barrel fold metal-dependent hydrolase
VTIGSSLLEGVPLVDHHCHGVTFADLGPAEFDELASESSAPGRPGRMLSGSQLGVVIRAECGPVLGLPRHASAGEYHARRAELGAAEVNRRLLAATGIGCYLIDTGYRGGELLGPEQMAEVSGQRAREVVRLEAVAEQLAESGAGAGGFARVYEGALAEAARGAAGLKSVMAYRFGLDFDPERPSPGEVIRAAGEWLRRCERDSHVRLDDPVLLRHVLWAGVDLGLPLQFHAGFGDADIVLHRCDPALLTGFIRAVQPLGTRVMLLHCYPYHRQAAYLAHVYPHVWFDVGSAVPHAGLGSVGLIAESLEVAPFDKVLFSTDAFGLAELYLAGAVLWRRGLAQVMDSWLARDWLSVADAERFAAMMAHGNARRAYGLPEEP